jgi:C4-type Zn-finger protein
VPGRSGPAVFSFLEQAVVNFQKQKQTTKRDQIADPYAPDCPSCHEKMWLSRLETKVAVKEMTSIREYECSQCQLSRVVVAREDL